MADFSDLAPAGFRDELNKINIWTSGSLKTPVAPLTTAGQASYVVPADVGDTAVSESLLSDRYYFVPILLRQAARLGDLVCHVLTASASSVARLGAYAANSEGLPGVRHVDAGTVDTSTTGQKAITVDLDLAAGWHWLVLVCNDGGVDFRVHLVDSISVLRQAVNSTPATSLISDNSESVDATAIVDPAPTCQWYGGNRGGVIFATVEAQP